MRLKKPWTKPEIRRLHVSDTYNPDDGLTRAQWKAACELRRRAEEDGNEASKTHADTLH
jgi:hypothetical protein